MPNHSNKYPIARFLSAVLEPAVILLTILIAIPLSPDRELDTDEGLNLMKGLMVGRGMKLYSEIWSDQPPLLSHLLGIWFNLFGFEITVGRALIVILTTAGTFSLFGILKETRGPFAAWFSVAVLLSSGRFIRYGAAIMVGMPSITFLLISCYLLVRYTRDRSNQLAFSLSAVFFSLALLTKLIVVIALPAIVFTIAFSTKTGARFQHNLSRCLLWTGISGGSLLAIVLLLSPDLVSSIQEQLIAPHSRAAGNSYSLQTALVRGKLAGDSPVFMLALCGLISSLIRLRRDAILPAVWLAGSLGFLLLHRPIWGHHLMYVTFPAAWLAALAADDLTEGLSLLRRSARLELRHTAKLATTLISVLGVAVWLSEVPIGASRSILNRGRSGYPLEAKLLEKMQLCSSVTNWVLTDRPIYPFMIEKPVPPSVAVISRKRIDTGSIQPADITRAIIEYKPEQILIKRFGWLLETTRANITKDYLPAYRKKQTQLYIRKDLIDCAKRKVRPKPLTS